MMPIQYSHTTRWRRVDTLDHLAQPVIVQVKVTAIHQRACPGGHRVKAARHVSCSEFPFGIVRFDFTLPLSLPLRFYLSEIGAYVESASI